MPKSLVSYEKVSTRNEDTNTKEYSRRILNSKRGGGINKSIDFNSRGIQSNAESKLMLDTDYIEAKG